MSWLEGKKILVPIDFSETSHRAVDAALQLCTHKGGVYTVHVAPDLMVMEPGVVWEETTDAAREKHLTEAYDNEYGSPQYDDVHFHVAFGDAGHEIAAYADQIQADLVVMPSHGRTGVKRMLIGSVAERVVRLAHCPVLVLKDPVKKDGTH